jgi:hypothetical protein
MAYILTPHTLAAMVNQDPNLVANLLRLFLSSLVYLEPEGEVICEGIGITLLKTSNNTFNIKAEVKPDDIAEIIEGEELMGINI